MANHTIDCKYCGQDQRIVGDNCCAHSIEFGIGEQVNTERNFKARIELLHSFGLDPYANQYDFHLLLRRLVECQEKTIKQFLQDVAKDNHDLEEKQRNCKHDFDCIGFCTKCGENDGRELW